MSKVAQNRLTDADRRRIEEMTEAGAGRQAIARTLGKHPSTIGWYQYSSGLKAPRQTDRPRTYTRNGVTVRGFSRDEDKLLERLRRQGLRPNAIAERMTAAGYPRNHHVVRCRLKMLAAIDDEADR